MTVYTVGAIGAAGALGLAIVLPTWVALVLVAVALAIIIGVLRSVDPIGRGMGRRSVPIPVQRRPVSRSPHWRT